MHVRTSAFRLTLSSSVPFVTNAMAKHDEIVFRTPDEEAVEAVDKKKKKVDGKDDKGQSASPVDDGEGEEGDEEEYEIESILDANRGYFGRVRFTSCKENASRRVGLCPALGISVLLLPCLSMLNLRVFLRLLREKSDIWCPGKATVRSTTAGSARMMLGKWHGSFLVCR